LRQGLLSFSTEQLNAAYTLAKLLNRKLSGAGVTVLQCLRGAPKVFYVSTWLALRFSAASEDSVVLWLFVVCRPRDITWHEDNWDNPDSRFLAWTLHDNREGGSGDVYIAFNAHGFEVRWQLHALQRQSTCMRFAAVVVWVLEAAGTCFCSFPAAISDVFSFGTLL
jgi:hypothetical protein